MTETSAFFNGTVSGDAIDAPYSSAFFARMLKSIYATSGAVVLPDELNNLEVTAAAGRTVSVNTGRAVIEGYWYENTAAYSVTLNQNTSTWGRYDRIVVEIDTVTNTCDIVAVRGVPALAPAVPPLPTCSTKYYLTLARIYLPPAYAATASYYIFDERVFANNAYHINTYNVQNTFPNGKFVAFGDSENTGVNRNPMPGGWVRYNTGSALKSLDRFDEMSAGRIVNSYSGAANDGWSYDLLTSDNFTGIFTLRLLVEVTEGECAIDFAGVSLQVPVSTGTQEIIIRVSATGHQSLDIYHQTGSDNFSFSDIRFTHGWVVPPYETYGNYIVMFDSPVKMKRTGSPVTSPLAGALGAHLIKSEYFGSDSDNAGVITEYWESKEVKDLIFLVGINDSGSAAGNAYAELASLQYSLGIGAHIRIDLNGIANDSPRYRLGVASGYLGQFYFRYTASGANAMDADISVVGVIL